LDFSASFFRLSEVIVGSSPLLRSDGKNIFDRLGDEGCARDLRKYSKGCCYASDRAPVHLAGHVRASMHRDSATPACAAGLLNLKEPPSLGWRWGQKRQILFFAVKSKCSGGQRGGSREVALQSRV